MPVRPDNVWWAWSADPGIVFGVGALAFLFARGTKSVWGVAGHGHGVRVWQVAAFGAALGTVVLALLSPLDALSDVLFSAHMTQHLLLVAVAAPLLAVARPVVPLLWAWPQPTRRAFVPARVVWRLVRWPRMLPLTFAVHSLLLWLWHVPLFYEAALHNVALHALEHMLLLGSAVAFWSCAWQSTPRGASVLYVFALGAQCTGLGALITFSARPWYASYSTTTAPWGLSAMDDQVLAGAIMWVPAGLVYLGLALALFATWLGGSESISRAEPAPPVLPLRQR